MENCVQVPEISCRYALWATPCLYYSCCRDVTLCMRSPQLAALNWRSPTNYRCLREIVMRPRSGSTRNWKRHLTRDTWYVRSHLDQVWAGGTHCSPARPKGNQGDLGMGGSVCVCVNLSVCYSPFGFQIDSRRKADRILLLTPLMHPIEQD